MVIQEHFFSNRRTLAQAKQLQHLIFLASEVYRPCADRDGLAVEVDHEVAGLCNGRLIRTPQQKAAAYRPKTTCVGRLLSREPSAAGRAAK